MLSKYRIFKKIKRKVELKLKQFGPFPTELPFCAIFLFHTVEIKPQPWTQGHRYVTAFDSFKTQIHYIKKHFQIVTSSELIESLRRGDFSQNTAAIHFDDGFRSYSDIVVPFLREQQIPSTIFLVNSVLDGEIPIRNKLAFCLNNEARSDFLSAWQKIIDKEDEADVDFSRMENSDILSWAKQAITKELEEVVAIFYKKYIMENHHSHPFLDRNEALEIKQETYVEFGSHTLHHLMLSQLNPEEQQYEIIEGHKNLEQFLEMELFHFAYPHGGQSHFNETSEMLVRKNKRITAYSSYGGVNFEYCSSNVKRISLSNHSPTEIKLAVLSSL
jgi:peptidoglycan/xylan/chitin deacetylase (PgdA/CDA1 family)